MPDQLRKKELGDALNDVLDSQHASEGELRDARALRRKRGSQAKYQPGLILFIVAAWGFIGYVWVARPGFIFGGQQAGILSPVEREARLRYGIYLQHGRVTAFRARSGRLPESLREAGPVEAGVEYERTTDDNFEVFGTADGTVLKLSDRMSADSFLGDALSRLLRPNQ